MLQTILVVAEQVGALRLAQRLSVRAGDGLYILAHHRVAYPHQLPLFDPQLINATPAQFEAQMRLIATHYNPVSAEQVLNALAGGRPLPREAVLVTVDDGYRDFKDVIFPICNRFNIRPILFVPTAYVGAGWFWWDRLYAALQTTQQSVADTPLGPLSLGTPAARQQAYTLLNNYLKQAPFAAALREIEELCLGLAPELPTATQATLDWDELQVLHQAGVTIAAHTHTHPVLSHITDKHLHFEIQESQRLIQQVVGAALPIFGVPYGFPGSISEPVLQALGAAGFQIAVTTSEGRANFQRDNHLALPRISSSPRLSLAQYHARLTPLYDAWKRSRR